MEREIIPLDINCWLYHALVKVNIKVARNKNGIDLIRCRSLTRVETGYQTTEIISYDVSVSPMHRQDIRQRQLFHTMSQSYLSTDRISDNGSYFRQWSSVLLCISADLSIPCFSGLECQMIKIDNVNTLNESKSTIRRKTRTINNLCA